MRKFKHTAWDGNLVKLQNLSGTQKRLMKCTRRKNKEPKKSNKALKVYYNRRVLAYYSHKKTSARELLKNNSAYWQTLLNAFSFDEKTTQTIH